MLIEAPGNLLCFAVELGFFLIDHPTLFTTKVATGHATVSYNQHRIFTGHVATAPRSQVCVVVCGVLSHLGSEN